MYEQKIKWHIYDVRSKTSNILFGGSKNLPSQVFFICRELVTLVELESGKVGTWKKYSGAQVSVWFKI